MNTRFSGGPKGVDGLPSGHPNLNGSHPCLLKDFPRGILVIEMLRTSLQPKDETAKDVKWFSDVKETPYMVPLDFGGVIFSLSKMTSPNMTNGQERVTSLGGARRNRRPSQGRLTKGHSRRQC
jgi:hypothetical protein